MNGEEEDITEFTDDELLKKLKGLEHTSPKLILEGSICSGEIFIYSLHYFLLMALQLIITIRTV